ncbi:MAG: ATP-binding protein [Eubacteriales bacterium]|nr:ATP-binding protein [Eubacteriales bacterium]
MEDIITLAEHRISKRYRKEIWRPFVAAIKQYKLIVPNDRIAVCMSGGKDSILLGVALRMLQRYSDFPFELQYIFMNPGFRDEVLGLIQKNMSLLGFSPHIFETDIMSVAENAKSPCHVCAAMRRGHLYKTAQELNCNKIALGHHMDDVAETVLISMLFGGEFKTMLPKLTSLNYENMQLIRPLYLVREKHIIRWQNSLKINSVTCECALNKKEDGGKRKLVKELLFNLEKSNPNIINNIFSSTQEVKLSQLLSYKKDDILQENF